ncbi:MAG: TIGR01244 family phosphatase [Roseibium sp.]|nr:TIGR01244 family phosphatase [Roseibium sp.]
MTPKQINADISVSPQILADDIKEIADLGYKAVICNRPDGEAFDQQDYQEIEAAAVAAGLEIRYLPITSGGLMEDDVLAFDAAFAELPKPVFAYCRSGTRCATVWAVAESRKRPVEDIVREAATAGYDLRPMFGLAG